MPLNTLNAEVNYSPSVFKGVKRRFCPLYVGNKWVDVNVEQQTNIIQINIGPLDVTSKSRDVSS